jgi:hypothetical protein
MNDILDEAAAFFLVFALTATSQILTFRIPPVHKCLNILLPLHASLSSIYHFLFFIQCFSHLCAEHRLDVLYFVIFQLRVRTYNESAHSFVRDISRSAVYFILLVF